MCFSKEFWYLTYQFQGLQSLKWGEVTYIHTDSIMGGGSMKQEDEWGEDTSRSGKMGGVYLGEGKNGGSRVKGKKKWGSTLRGRKKWGEYTLAAEGRGVMSTPPPQGVFGTFPYMAMLHLPVTPLPLCF